MSYRKRQNGSHEKIGIVVFFLVFTLPVPVQAQVSSISSIPAQSLYEGQTISAVELIANPSRDVEALRPLVLQKAGQPFSEASVRATIDALANRGFSNVGAEMVSNASGLQLNFIIEPPYYVGMIEFPGLAKHFSYPQLLKVVNLSDDEPYDKGRIVRYEEALVQFFRHDGYFQAKVHAEPTIDDAHQLVNIRFFVDLGERARIGNVVIRGIPEQESRTVLQKLSSRRARFTGAQLKAGKPYTADRLKAATVLIKKNLAAKHRFASKVQNSPPQYHPDSNLADVSFHGELGPLISVRVSGARISIVPFVSRRQVKKLIPIYSEGAIDQDLLKEGERNLTEYFKKKGFFDVEVKTDSQKSPDRIAILYEVKRGKKHKVHHISFSGANRISEKELLGQVSVKKSRLFSRGKISQKLVTESEENLRALYQERGYENVKVTPKITDRDPKIDLSFEIEEGPQTLVDNVHVIGNDHVPVGELSGPKGFQLQPKKPFSDARLSDDRNRILATYLNRGYLNAEVNATVQRNQSDPLHVDVTYAVAERQLVQVSQVTYVGREQTRLSMIQNTARIRPKTPMKRGDLLEAESRLFALNIFDWSKVGPKRPITDQTDEAAVVRVHESSRNEIAYGFGFDVAHRGGNVPSGSVAVPGLPPVDLQNHEIAPSEATYAGPRGSIEFSRRNMRGLGETASTFFLVSRLDQQIVLSYTQPQVIGSQWSSITSFSGERTTENPLYAAQLGTGSFQIEHLISRKKDTRLQLRYRFNKTYLTDLLVPELVLPQDRDVRLSTISGAIIRDTRDNLLDAHRGTYATVNLGLTPTALGSSATFAKLFGQYAYYRTTHSIVFANSVRLGLAKAMAGSFVPTSELFFSGGGTTLRGFPINQAGPQRIVPFCDVLEGESGCVNVTVPVGGRQLFILNSEMRFPLGIKKALGGVVFYDGGNVYSAINLKDLVHNYTNTVGFGLRYSTPIGPIRIDVAHNLNPVSGITPTQYFITLGQAF
jgi:outer membrane protein assembly factor BamA